jgi:hypothetical protein
MLPTIVGPIEKLIELVKQTSNLEGDYWECGIYNGGSASAIYEAIPSNRNLILFDSFEGLPQETEHDNFHKKGDFSDVNYENVKAYFSNHNNVTIVKGFIPETFKDFTESKLCFVHLDLDLYEGYKYTLDFVWPRLVSGGIIALDDYAASTCAGAKKATDEFVKLHGLTVIDHYYIIKE